MIKKHVKIKKKTRAHTIKNLRPKSSINIIQNLELETDSKNVSVKKLYIYIYYVS